MKRYYAETSWKRASGTEINFIEHPLGAWVKADEAQDEIDRLTKIVQVPAAFCEWREDRDGCWNTDCDMHFVMTADTPSENNYNYCPSCGRKLIEIPWSCDDTEHDEGESTSPFIEMTDDDVEWLIGAND